MINFTNAAFLTGTLAVSVPVILHFLKNKPVTETKFPSFMFLHHTLAAAASKNRIRKWLVLILRSLAVILLSAAFARPYFSAITPGIKSAEVIIFDNSMSMSAAEYTSYLKNKAVSEISGASHEHRIKICLAGASNLWSDNFSEDPEYLKEFFSSNTFLNSTSSLSLPIEQADNFLSNTRADSKTILIISDRQKKPWTKFQTSSILSPGESLKTLFPENPGFENIAIFSDRAEIYCYNSDSKVTFPFTVKNYSETKTFSAEINIIFNGKNIYTNSITLNPEASFTEKVYITPTGKKVIPGKITLKSEDDIKKDNTFFFALKKKSLPLTAVYPFIKGKFNFTEKALSTSAKTAASKIIQLNAVNCNKADFFILKAPLPLTSQSQIPFLKAVKSGKSAFIIWKNSPAYRSFLYSLGIRVTGNASEERSYFENINFNHPLFSAFKNVKLTAFSEVYFKSRALCKLPDNASVIAEFSDNSPALAEIPYGKGKIFFLAASAERKNSNWPVHSTYLPFLREMLRISLKKTDSYKMHIPGETIHFKEKSAVYTTGDNISKITEQTNSFTPDSPGCFTITDNHSVKILCVNYPQDESDSKILNKNFSAIKLVGEQKNISQYSGNNLYGQNSENNTTNNTIWFYLLAAAVIFIFAELLISNRTAL